MDNNQIVEGLQTLYDKFMANGNWDKAQEVLFKIQEMKATHENVNQVDGKDILLG
jgi:hypothetical protein